MSTNVSKKEAFGWIAAFLVGSVIAGYVVTHSDSSGPTQAERDHDKVACYGQLLAARVAKDQGDRDAQDAANSQAAHLCH